MAYPKYNILIIGGLGFLGAHLNAHLVKLGHAVRILDLNLKESFIQNQSNIIFGNYSDSSILAEALKDIDYVFHLASTTLPKSSNDCPHKDISENLLASINLLENIRNSSVKKVIYFSSGGTVYGPQINYPINEESPTNPICSYGIHKLAVEKYLNLYHRLYETDYTILRISNPFGNGQSPRSNQGLVAVIKDKIEKNTPLEVWGKGDIVRDYIYVDDVINAAISILSYKGKHHIFNVGSGKGFSINNIIQFIKENINDNFDVVYKDPRALDVEKNILDIQRLSSETGWLPTLGLFDFLLESFEKL
jgi:UDP-glucose 4-epimerase